MVRPQKISDQELLTAAGAVIGRLGPAFTIADVAATAKVSVGTVAQRFGNKAGLLTALTRVSTERTLTRMRAAAAAGTPLQGLRAAVCAAYEVLDDTATAGNHLAQLAVDLADPTLRVLLGEHFAAVRGELRRLVRGAAAELPGAPPPAGAARMLAALAHGTAFDWSVHPTGSLADRLRGDVDAVLNGWRGNGRSTG